MKNGGMNFAGRVGSRTIQWVSGLTGVAAAVFAVFVVAAGPRRYWSGPVRTVLMRQVLFTGLESTWLIGMVASLLGISIAIQAQLWLGAIGMLDQLGAVMVAVVVREIGPLLTNLIVIARSGSGMATELGGMSVNGEVRLLESLGVDPFVYLVTTRVFAMGVSVFCLSIIFIVMCFVSSYIIGFLIGAVVVTPHQFAYSVFAAVRFNDVFNLAARTILPAMASGVICCREGLRAQHSITEVSQATTRAVVRSMVAVFAISALSSIIMYM